MAANRHSARGFTLLEVMVVVMLIGLVMGSATMGIRSIAKSDLRAAAAHFSGAARYLFDRASTTGKFHRLVIDIDEGKYWAEESDDRFFIPREKESEETKQRDEEREKEEKEEAKRRAEELAGNPAAEFDIAQIKAEDFRPKRARFAAFKATALKPVKLKNAKIVDVYTPRLEDPATKGQTAIYFFPMGQAEAAIVHLSDKSGETQYSLVIHPITGRVKLYNEYIKPPVAERYDDEGNRIEE